MKQQILIFYHIPEREKVLSELLKEQLKKEYCDYEVLAEEFYYACAHMNEYNPKIVITFLPRDSYSCNFLTLFKYIYNPLVIAVPTEGVMDFDSETIVRYIGYNEYSASLVDYYFFWGCGMAEIAKEILLSERKVNGTDRIQIFGYLLYDISLVKNYKLCESELNYAEIASRYEKTILVATSFHNANITIEELKNEMYFNTCSFEEIENAKKRIRSDKYYEDKYLDLIEESVRRYPSTCFIIKLHPVEMERRKGKKDSIYNRFERYENVFIIEKPIQISYFFDFVDLFLHYGSTAALEAYIYKIPTIQLLNNYEMITDDSLGRAYFESTYMIDVVEKEEFFALLEHGVAYKKLPDVENALYRIMNYTVGMEYHPADILISFIKEHNTPQMLYKKDKLVAQALKSKQCILFMMSMVKNYFICLLSGNKEKCKLYTNMFKRYHEANRRHIISE